MFDTKKAKTLINKIHIFQLYKADFNSYLNNILGRRLMEHSKTHRLNEHQLYGTRKERITYDTFITTRVIYDMAKIQGSILCPS